MKLGYSLILHFVYSPFFFARLDGPKCLYTIPPPPPAIPPLTTVYSPVEQTLKILPHPTHARTTRTMFFMMRRTVLLLNEEVLFFYERKIARSLVVATGEMALVPAGTK